MNEVGDIFFVRDAGCRYCGGEYLGPNTQQLLKLSLGFAPEVNKNGRRRPLNRFKKRYVTMQSVQGRCVVSVHSVKIALIDLVQYISLAPKDGGTANINKYGARLAQGLDRLRELCVEPTLVPKLLGSY